MPRVEEGAWLDFAPANDIQLKGGLKREEEEQMKVEGVWLMGREEGMGRD